MINGIEISIQIGRTISTGRRGQAQEDDIGVANYLINVGREEEILVDVFLYDVY